MFDYGTFRWRWKTGGGSDVNQSWNTIAIQVEGRLVGLGKETGQSAATSR
jgi:hypothetical protein